MIRSESFHCSIAVLMVVVTVISIGKVTSPSLLASDDSDIIFLNSGFPPRMPVYGASESSDLSGSKAFLITRGLEEPLIATAPTSREEDDALLRAIGIFRERTTVDDFRVLETFLSDYPHSGWRMSLLANLGMSYYHYGYFSKTLDAWKQAWSTGRSVTEPRAKALVDRVVGELARMHARLGHSKELAALFAEVGERPLTGPATETFTGAKEGLWMMKNEPGFAYLCGPMALKNLLLFRGTRIDSVRFLDAYRSGRQGVSLAEVARLARKAKLPHRLIFRQANQPIPVPSIVHWKVSHFAAVLSDNAGRYHIQDPTFGQDLWVTRAALESESSGYFLVPDQPNLPQWRKIKAAEASGVRGMGYTTTSDPDRTTPQDRKVPRTPCNRGMCGYSVHEMLVSLNLSDTPIGYAPPIGPAVYVTLTYNQREANQPANFKFFNVGPKWTLNWLSYIQDDPTHVGTNVMRYVAGGGAVRYSSYNTSTNTFSPESGDASVLVRSPATPIAYERRLNDGSREVYAQSDGSTGYPRRVFLTQIIDPSGNAVSLSYDVQLRLRSITDALGQVTTFSYELPSQPLLVTRITDPFGRRAELNYNAQGSLRQLTDVLGLTSNFDYDLSSLVILMTTPYGRTQFAYGQTGEGTSSIHRWLVVTDPLGYKERVEFLHRAPGIPGFEPPQAVPQGIPTFNTYLDARNTFYWDKHANQVAPGDYTKAQITHWTHLTPGVTGHLVEGRKLPFENRIWFNYVGQQHATSVATLDKPTHIRRVLDDGCTQLTRFDYNQFGKVTRRIDPMGRETLFEYDTNQIDLLRVKQKTSTSGISPAPCAGRLESGGGWTIVAEYSDYSQHLPRTYRDAAGQTTTFLYNSAGQLKQITNPEGHITNYEYDGGYLRRILNANNNIAAQFDYDGFGRVATRRDSEGHAVSFEYDALDRVVTEKYPDGTVREYKWDKLDLVEFKDRQGRTTKHTYDAGRNLKEITDPLGRITQFDYYENGQLKSLTDPNGNTTTWDIDIQGRVTAKQYADGRRFTNTFENTTSRLKAITDALKQEKQYTYSIDDQIDHIDYVNALTPTHNVQFTYDAYFPRVTSMTDGSGTTQYAYQAVGLPGALRLRQEDGPYQNDAIAYQYDSLGRMIGRTIDVSSEMFTYDKLGRTITHQNALGVFDFRYLGETSQLVSRRERRGFFETGRTYETNTNDRRLKAITNTRGARGYEYTITPENVISQIVETPAMSGLRQTWNYTYDVADRLLGGQSSAGTRYAYRYDPADNITSLEGPAGVKRVTHNSLNQIASVTGQGTSLGGSTYKYDANGNLGGDGERTYKWDAEDRLISISYKSQPTRRTLFRYDGLGRRIAIVSANGTNSVETRYLWCGEVVCQARAANDAVSRRYYPEGELSSSGAGLFYAQDHLGSVRDVSVNGALGASYDYDPYGNPVQSGGTISTDFRYAGMFYHSETGLYLTKYRVYDPGTGRWLSRDPIRAFQHIGILSLEFHVDKLSRPLL